MSLYPNRGKRIEIRSVAICHHLREFRKYKNGRKMKDVIKRLVIAIIPTTIVTLNYKWAVGAYPLAALIVSWVVIVWSAWHLESENRFLARYYKIASIGFAISPLSAIAYCGKLSEADAIFPIVAFCIIGVPVALVFHIIAKDKLELAQEEEDRKELKEFQEELTRIGL